MAIHPVDSYCLTRNSYLLQPKSRLLLASRDYLRLQELAKDMIA